MKNKSIIWGIILVLLLSSIIPITYSYEITSNNIIYVDDDGGADYTKIQDAIDNASDGDTVFVYGGIYYETLVLRKSILLEGENKYTTILDGKSIDYSYGIRLSHYSRWFSPMITGFTIQNFDVAIIQPAPIGGLLNINISNNILTNNGGGIAISGTIGGLHVGFDITNNIIENNYYGVYLTCFKNILIKRNKIASNSGYGIKLDGGRNYVRIIENNIFNNTVDAFVNSYGYLGMFSSVFLNKWNRNYWGGDYQKIKVIPGDPCNVYDWNPVKEPYNIQEGKH